ncbi:hypothetical protein HYW99_02945 [Candidatus Woesearchaeota archaeon]|nr:hypothetical protein [Candidatus Woesearchaeota archaeon]
MSNKGKQNYPTVKEDKIYVDKSEEDVDVSQDRRRDVFDRSRPLYVKGLKVSYHIPFEGDRELFKYQTSSFTYSPPRAEIRSNEIIIEVIELDHNTESVKKEFEQNFNEIKKWLNWVNQEITQFNNSLDGNIEHKIKTRKDKLIKDKNLVSELGFPLKKRKDSIDTYTIAEFKRKISISRPTATTSAIKLEPTLSITEYDNILKIISGMALVMERSPKAFSEMEEENIRQHFLVQLNGQYEGQATGETFNYEGKTDILIRVDGKNIFIAECKFWRGKENLIETIDQILKYLSWRDTKAAILLFNRNKDLSNVLSQIPEIFKEHPNFKKQVDYSSETGFRFILHHKDDKERELYLTILVFEVPA